MPDTSDNQQLFQQSFAQHQSGRLQEAEAGYRRVLAANPNHADALHFLGIVAIQTGHFAPAMQLIEKSIQIAPTFGAHNNLGEAYRNVGRTRDAVSQYRASLQLNPNHVDALINLVIALTALDETDEAEPLIERAIAIAPQRAMTYDVLGLLRSREKDYKRAAIAHRKAIELDANLPTAHANLAMLLAKEQRFPEAIELAECAVAVGAHVPKVREVLGQIFEEAGEYDKAILTFQQAVQLHPRIADFYGRLGAIFAKLERVEEGVQVLQAGIANCPPDGRLFNALSSAYRRSCNYSDAVRMAEEAIKLAPSNGDAHGSLALALLGQGDYARGFAEYEWRWRAETFTTRARDFNRPIWNAGDLKNRSILVHTEQGFGDTIQFARYLPILAARGAKVIVECHHSIRTLIQTVTGVSSVVAGGLALPPTDLHVPLMSLPSLLGTKSVSDVPIEVPYLFPDVARVELWKERTTTDKLKVGLIWIGNKDPDSKRTVPSSEIVALAGLDRLQFFGLLKGDSSKSVEPDRANAIRAMEMMKMIDLAPQISDFHDTAAAMMAMDLIIAIDTATAHLAGALGRPTWALLPRAADWRWENGVGESSVWYPTMRLFRQQAGGDWGDVLTRVRSALEEFGHDGTK